MDFDYLYNSIEARGSKYSDFAAKPRSQWPCRLTAFHVPPGGVELGPVFAPGVARRFGRV